MKTLSNDKITLQISESGAELTSIVANGTNTCGRPTRNSGNATRRYYSLS